MLPHILLNLQIDPQNFNYLIHLSWVGGLTQTGSEQ
jgi:hypothetical protein